MTAFLAAAYLGNLHKVPDEIVLAQLREDIDEACETTDWHAAIAFSDGRIVLAASHFATGLARQDHLDKIAEIARIANRDCANGGHWVIAFADDTIHGLWRDKDGDMQLTNSFAEPWRTLSARTGPRWVEVLDACWTKAMQMLRDQGLKPEHQIKRAQGERSRARR